MRATVAAALAIALLCAPAAQARDGDGWKPRARIAPPGRARHAKADPRIVALVAREAARQGVPGNIAHAVIRQESGYRPHVTGRAGEIGLGQLKCATARLIGFTGKCRALYDAAVNARWTMRHLRLALDRGGATCAGVALHNRGLWAKRLTCTPYGKTVMANARRMK